MLKLIFSAPKQCRGFLSRLSASLAAGALAALFAGAPSAAPAATFTVSNTDDSGAGSLRQAILDASGAFGDDIIVFDSFFATPRTIALTTTELLIDSNIDIQGPGANLLTVRAPAIANVRTFAVSGANTVATLAGMTISGDNDATPISGGIYSFGFNIQLNIANSTIRNNSNTTGGGGVDNAHTVTITNCTISNNSGIIGGGVFSSNLLRITGSTISNNLSSFQGGGVCSASTGSRAEITNSMISNNSRGGVCSSLGTLIITNSTINNNSTSSHGGGVLLEAAFETTITNSTINGNSAGISGNVGGGGGVFGDSITLTITNSTISGNSSSFSGGGIANVNVNSPTINNTIIANNMAAFGGDDVSGSFNSGGYNLIGDGTDATGFGAVGDQVGTLGSPIDPLLDPLGLQNNGGPTLTIALCSDSPALDAGNTAQTTDQRGIARPQGSADDIGAFEGSTGMTCGPDPCAPDMTGPVIDCPMNLALNNTAGLCSAPAPDLTLLVDSVTEFSGTQGQNGWTYGHAQEDNIASFALQTVFTGAEWTFPPASQFANLPHVFAIGAHPTDGSATPGGPLWAVRRWTSDYTGPVIISGMSGLAQTIDDGTDSIIFHNGAEVFRVSNLISATTAPYTPVELTIASGDTIDFVVDRRANQNNDNTTFTAVIRRAAEDMCDGIVPITQDPAPGDPLMASLAPHVVTLSAMDSASNSSSCDVMVTVNDTENPTIISSPACGGTLMVNTGPGAPACGANATVTASAMDNCSATLSYALSGATTGSGSGGNASGTYNVGTTTVTFTATDPSSNTATCVVTVVVTDNTPPVAIAQNVTVILDASGNGSTTATAVNNGSSDACGIQSLSLSQTAFTCSHVGPNTVTLTVTDVNNNVSTTTATVTVVDNTPPVAIAQNVMVILDSSGNGSTTAGAVNNGSADACGIQSLSLSQTAFNCSHVGPNTVTLTVTDVNNNVSTTTATVTVVDNTPPVAIAQNVTVILDATGNGSTTAAAVNNGSSDACGIQSLSLSQTAFTCANVGPNTVTLTVTDVNTNVSTAMATVTVVDNTPPVFTSCPTDIVVNKDPGVCGAVVTYTTPTASDNCSAVVALTAGLASGSLFPIGTTTVTHSATDPSGNTASPVCSFTVTVLGAEDLDLAGFAANKLSATFGDGPTAPGIAPSPGTSSDFPSALASRLGPSGIVYLAAASRKEQVVWLFELDAATGFIMDQTRFGSGTTPALHGGFPSASLAAGDGFGSALAWLGDYGTNGTMELAVGVPGEDGGTANSNRGGYWVVSVNLANAFDGNPATLPATSATLVSPDAIDAASADSILANVGLGSALSALDANADGLADWLAAGAPNRVNTSGHQAGGLWLLDLSATGTTAAAYRFLAPDETLASVAYAAIQSRYSDALAWLGDADANPATFEIAAGSPHHRSAQGGLAQSGIFHVQSFDLTGASPVLMASFPVGGSTGLGGFPSGQLGQADFFGQSLALLGDIDADGYLELAVGAPGDDDGGSNQGAVWVLTLDLCSAPNISIEQGKVTELAPNDLTGFGTTPLDSTDYFGWSLAALPPPTGADAGLAAGALYDDDGGSNRGAVWVLDVSDND
jgi:hypothetical protein